MEYKRLTQKDIANLQVGVRVNMGNGRIVTITNIVSEIPAGVKEYNAETQQFEARPQNYIYWDDGEKQGRWFSSVLQSGTIETLDKTIIKCAYCGALRTSDEMMQGTIIFQSGRSTAFGYQKFVDEKTNWYCKDKPCHGYDQMGHEG